MLVFGIFGALTGASRQIANALALAFAYLCARPLGNALGPTFARALGGPLLFGVIAATLVVFVLVLIAARHALTGLFRHWLESHDPRRPGTGGADRWLGFFLAALKVAAIAYVMVSALAFVEDNVQVAGRHLGISPKGSLAFSLARRFNLFEAVQFRPVKDLLQVARAAGDPERAHALESDPAFRALKADPRFRRALTDRAMQKALASGDLRALLRSDAVMELIQDPTAAARLKAAADRATH